ncbi:putative membrane protein [Clostridioides difficile P32]|nr:putative membrane protein [Clostridioides difficile P3]EQJ62713.1 putative membrane protein [Clostridioides difficile P32]EQK23187.1 putative membrane protein [Clostridioides difficile P72]EQL10523.1 putative membrane protein [Clostridioides difficile CD88]ERM50111.1 putative membrane protein [Clostridioides difficile P53]
MPLYSMLSIIVSIFLIILGIKVRKKFLIIIAIISIIINILIILDR